MNLALGVVPDARYGVTKLPLARIDTLLLHSDGVTDARSPGGARFGEAGLEGFLKRSAHLGATALRRELVAELHRFTGSRLDHDDVTIVALAVR